MRIVRAVLAALCLAYIVFFFIVSFENNLKARITYQLTNQPDLNASENVDKLQSDRFITRIVHHSWKVRQLPTKRAEAWSASWRKCFPNWQWRLWTDEDNLALVRDHYPWFLPVYLSFSKSIERADVARYFYMFHYGGIYTDLDNVCIRNFEHLLNSTALLFGGMDGIYDNEPLLGTYVQNSFMASRPGHPFWMRLISLIMIYKLHGRPRDNGRPAYITGPEVLMEELRQYRRGAFKDAQIYPGMYFNPFSWYRNNVTACKDLGRMTDVDEARCIAAFPNAFVVQLHTQSWLLGHL